MKIRNTIRPPRLASLFFEWYCENASIEDLHGDMEELFYSNLERTSPWRAKVKYVLQVLSLVFSYAVKKRKSNASYHPYSNNSISIAMIKSYFIIAWRNLMRNRGFSLINISGLSLGITCSLLIFLWVNDELHVDASQADDNV